MLKSVDFGRFMMPEGTETFILAFTSKTGQHTLLFEFFCQRGDIFRHFIGLISDSRRKGSQDRTKQRGFLCIFSLIFSSPQPAPVHGNADLLYHLSRLNQNTQHISCRVKLMCLILLPKR